MIHESAESTGSAERLWELVRDIERWAERVPSVHAITHLDGPSPPAVGSRYTLEQLGLPPAVYEITEWDEAGRSFVWTSTAPGVRTSASHVVTALDAGSRLDLRVGFTGILGALMGRAMKGKASRMVRTEADAFARLAEKL